MPKNKKNKIVELDKEHLRDLDGVTMDLDSYAKHTKPQIKTKNEPVKQTETKNEPKQPIGVFACNPVHIGWYTTGETKQQINYPIMAGAIKPNQEINN